MNENEYAIHLPNTPENQMKYGGANLNKFVLTGPGELANNYINSMLHDASFAGVEGAELDEVCRVLPHIACEISRHFWNDCAQRGWLLSQMPPPDPITGTSHADISDMEHPRTMSHEEFLAQQAGNVTPIGIDGEANG